jgi:hypothetical protein
MCSDALPAITITPDPALSDDPVRIHLRGFAPGQRVTLRAAMADDAGQRWRSWAEFAANDAGDVDLATAAPLAGSYSSADAIGLFWSMARADDEDNEPATFARTTTHPLTITCTAEADGRVVATAHHTRLGMAAGVRRVEARERGLVGALFLPPGEGPHPGVIVLGGSSGGMREPLAALLASHGCAALALAYFGVEGLPPQLADIPLEYFETALDSDPSRCARRAMRAAGHVTWRGAGAAPRRDIPTGERGGRLRAKRRALGRGRRVWSSVDVPWRTAAHRARSRSTRARCRDVGP